MKFYVVSAEFVTKKNRVVTKHFNIMCDEFTKNINNKYIDEYIFTNKTELKKFAKYLGEKDKSIRTVWVKTYEVFEVSEYDCAYKKKGK
jgi:hypothetical protein